MQLFASELHGGCSGQDEPRDIALENEEVRYNPKTKAPAV